MRNFDKETMRAIDQGLEELAKRVPDTPEALREAYMMGHQAGENASLLDCLHMASRYCERDTRAQAEWYKKPWRFWARGTLTYLVGRGDSARDISTSICNMIGR